MSKSFLSLFLPWQCPACRPSIRPLLATKTRPQRRHLSVATRLRKDASTSADASDTASVRAQHLAEVLGDGDCSRLYPTAKESVGESATESIGHFIVSQGERFAKMKPGELCDFPWTIHGRIRSRRKAGSKLHFIDMGSALASVQLHWNPQRLKKEFPDQLEEEFLQEQYGAVEKSLKKGSWIIATGYLFRNERDARPNILLSEPPRVVSPTLVPVPEKVTSQEYLMRNRHVEAILDGSTLETTMLRAKLIDTIRNFFITHFFVEVSTPLLAADAGGASARPFVTHATEFKDTPLRLRIAPELWLKRLLVGDLDRVFEIGPAFRNEGIDKTHNPEFTVCEFYAAMMSLEQMLQMTEGLLRLLSDVARRHHHIGARWKSLVAASTVVPDSTPRFTDKPFPRLEFIPTLVAQARERLPAWTFPDLDAPSARSTLLELTAAFTIPFPSTADPETIPLPRLLDLLASALIEPLTLAQPTWITHHPALMSPLAKSTYHTLPTSPSIQHHVSRRAELFIRGREYVNCYEEENDPIAQRHKFEQQLALRTQASGEETDDGASAVDEGYISALEWGLPPTGGWGCGIDRVVMLFANKERIADVLPFGNLANVVGLARGGESVTKEVAGRVERATAVKSVK